MMWWFLILGSTSGVVLLVGIALYLRDHGLHDLRELPIRSTSVLTHA